MTKKTHPERQLLGAIAFLGVMATVGAAAVPSASAQNRKTRAKPKATASAQVSATAAPASSTTPASGSSGGAPSGSAVPATGPVPAPRNDPSADGSARPSPLNPNADEIPGYVAPGTSAGAPLPVVDYDKLLGDIAALRARVADVGDALFVSHIVLSLETDGDHAKIGHLTVELDDGVVYTAPASFHSSDPTPIYEHAVAPGHHAVTIEVDRKDDRDDSFRDAQRSRFIVDVPKDSRLNVTLQVGDDSDMGGSFPGDHRGKYDLRVRMKAVAAPVKR